MDKTEGGLFENFEVNRESFWPRIRRLLAGSIVLHVIVAACVVLIPPLRDALSIALVLSGGRFVDRPYAKTEIGDQADIVEFATEKFHYPEGYFAMDQEAPGALPFPTPFNPFTLGRGSRIKVVNPFPSPTPTPSPAGSPSPAVAANAGPPPTASPVGPKQPTPDAKSQQNAADEKAQRELAQTAKENRVEVPKEGEINTKPFKDLATDAIELKNKGQLNFEQSFEMTIESELNKDGKLVNPTVTKKAGDPILIDLAKKLVSAMNDSGVLSLLSELNKNNPGTKVVFTIKQDTDKVAATVASEASSVEDARILAKGFNAALAYGASKRAGKNEEPLLKNTTASQDGKKIIFNFTMPRAAVADLIKKGMASATATPSGTPS